jgi:uncharacterized protein DUF6894
MTVRWRMPRYFFHIRRGQDTIVDRSGIELGGIEEAAKEAARRGREIAAHEALNGIRGDADEECRTIMELRLED